LDEKFILSAVEGSPRGGALLKTLSEMIRFFCFQGFEGEKPVLSAVEGSPRAEF